MSLKNTKNKDIINIKNKQNNKDRQNEKHNRKLNRSDINDLDIENPINKLFEYIRNHDWENFKNLLDSDDTIDVNVRDIYSNHLLTYAVRFNRLDIVTLLLDKGARYDIVDRMERSILYDAIELNFNSI